MSRRSDPRHRRAGVSGQFLPTQLAGCALWLRADLGITIGTGVSAWADQSGNAHNVTQGTGAAQPTYTTSDAAYNNKPVLNFASASSQFMQSAVWGVTLAQPYTVILVGNTDQTATQFFYDSVSGAESTIDPTTTTIGFFAGTQLSPAGSVTSPCVLAFIANGGSSSGYKNSSQTAIVSGAAGSNSMNGTTIGASNVPSNFINGRIAEFVIYNRALAAADLLTLFKYLGARYGIATS
jgi:hypothetical protein